MPPARTPTYKTIKPAAPIVLNIEKEKKVKRKRCQEPLFWEICGLILYCASTVHPLGIGVNARYQFVV